MDHSRLLQQLSIVYPKPFRPEEIDTIPSRWYKELFSTRRDQFLSGEEWRMAREKAGLPIPTIYYGTTSKPIDTAHGIKYPEVPPMICTEYQEHNHSTDLMNDILPFIRPADQLLVRRHTRYLFPSPPMIIYSYYIDRIGKKIITGILCLEYIPHDLPLGKYSALQVSMIPTDLHIQLLYTDGSIRNIGSELLFRATCIVLLSGTSGRLYKTVTTTKEELYYTKHGFSFGNTDDSSLIVYHPRAQDIVSLLDHFPSYYHQLKKYYPHVVMEYDQDAERRKHMKLQEESEYSDSFGGTRKHNKNRSKTKKHNKRTSTRYSKKIRYASHS